MAAGDRGYRGKPRRSGPASGPRRGAITLRTLADGAFELVHPRCVEERFEDLDEGLEIWRAGEPEEARDALRFALEGCGDNLFIHIVLGRIALESFRDPALARGHFGYAFDLVFQAIPRDFTGRVPADRPANRPLYDAIEGLARCFEAQGQGDESASLRRLAARFDRKPR